MIDNTSVLCNEHKMTLAVSVGDTTVFAGALETEVSDAVSLRDLAEGPPTTLGSVPSVAETDGVSAVDPCGKRGSPTKSSFPKTFFLCSII